MLSARGEALWVDSVKGSHTPEPDYKIIPFIHILSHPPPRYEGGTLFRGDYTICVDFSMGRGEIEA